MSLHFPGEYSPIKWSKIHMALAEWKPFFTEFWLQALLASVSNIVLPRKYLSVFLLHFYFLAPGISHLGHE